MTLVDLLVLVVVAIAALRGWRRGGTGLVLRATGAVVGVLALGAVARWYDPTSAALALGAVLVGALLGWAVGRRLGERLAVRPDGHLRRPGIPDRLLGVVAHGVLAVGVLVVAAAIVSATGPASLADAAGRSDLLATAAAHLPAPSTLLADSLDRTVPDGTVAGGVGR